MTPCPRSCLEQRSGRAAGVDDHRRCRRARRPRGRRWTAIRGFIERSTIMAARLVSGTCPPPCAPQFPVFERLSYLNAGSVRPDAPRRRSRRRVAELRTQAEGARVGSRAVRAPGAARDASCASARRALLGADPGRGCPDRRHHRRRERGDRSARARPRRRGADQRRGAPRPAGAAGAPRASGAGFAVRVVPFADVAGEVGPATRLVACSHVSWLTGRDRRHRGVAAAGPPVLLDGAQALGAVPVDVARSAATSTPHRARSGCAGRSAAATST